MSFKRRGVPSNAVLIERVRDVIGNRAGLEEKRMFGGVCFILNGNMACGVLDDDLVVRLGVENHEKFADRPHVAPMVVGEKLMRGILRIQPPGTKTKAGLQAWVTHALDHAKSLPSK